jgi:hypothetical protein
MLKNRMEVLCTNDLDKIEPSAYDPQHKDPPSNSHKNVALNASTRVKVQQECFRGNSVSSARGRAAPLPGAMFFRAPGLRLNGLLPRSGPPFLFYSDRYLDFHSLPQALILG